MFQPVEDFPLYPFNTFGMDVRARYFDILSKEEELLQLRSTPEFENGLLVLGGGSNILFTKTVNQWVVRNEIRGIEKIKEDESFVWLQAGAGEVWHGFVLYCVNKGLGGVENLSLIPGTVGASPIQNIGAYGVEVKDVIDSVRFFDLEQERFETFDATQCRFGYRDSIFKNELKGKIIITSVVFRLRKQPEFNTSYGNIREELDIMGVTELSVKSISDAVIRIRSSKLPDPKEIGNAGSFFKNPEVPESVYLNLKEKHPAIPGYKVQDDLIKIPAGWLIEQCGWKGFREHDYGVHRNQALVLVNYGRANGHDIKLLSERIMSSVAEQYGIALEREVQIV